MKKAILSLIICTFVLALVIGCTKEEVSEESMLSRIETSLKAQGFTVVSEGRQSSDNLEQVYPYKYKIKQNEMNEDYLLIYIFSSKDLVNKGISNQHYNITTLTKFKNYINKNVLVVHFASEGNLDKYKQKLEEAISKIS
ncbi:hypothetical protein H8B09_17880 [Paenibacillus sp. PR3]|uniref:DUF4825 domain-containing protein n=1 Tax=Paenibacillus terricola TaxID=2763503 RepID=A0ABR8N1G4_9BACL|nr:hypothetical protein [Paenibacillus terricola]MBD3920639.1 hypothetical protein [Paenibacillus terricola]